MPVMLSPGEKHLTPEQAKKAAQGKMNPLDGKTVPGKAKVSGDSLKNDVVPEKLAKGSVVIKRSVVNEHDPKKAMAFVQAVMAKSGMRRK